jgi:hypothetical protein
VPTRDGPSWNRAWYGAARDGPSWNRARYGSARDGPSWNRARYGPATGGRPGGGGVIHGDGPGGFLNTLCHPFGKGPDTGGDSYSLPPVRYQPKG